MEDKDHKKICWALLKALRHDWQSYKTFAERYPIDANTTVFKGLGNLRITSDGIAHIQRISESLSITPIEDIDHAQPVIVKTYTAKIDKWRWDNGPIHTFVYFHELNELYFN